MLLLHTRCAAAALLLWSQRLLAVALLYLLIMFRLEEFREVVMCLPSKIVVVALSFAALAFFVLCISSLSLVLLLILVPAALRLQYYIATANQHARLFHARFFLLALLEVRFLVTNCSYIAAIVSACFFSRTAMH